MESLLAKKAAPFKIEEAEVIASTSLSPQNEFLRSFESEEFVEYIPYGVFKDLDGDFETVYANGFNEYNTTITVNTRQILQQKIYYAGDLNNWDPTQDTIEKVGNTYTLNLNMLARPGQEMENESTCWSWLGYSSKLFN